MFSPDQVLVLLGDDLSDPNTFRSVYGFVGVDPSHTPRVDSDRTNAGVYDLRRLRLLRTRARFAWDWDRVTEYSYRPRRLRKPVGSLVTAGVVAADRLVLSRVLTEERPTLRPDLERRLRANYDDDVARLETMLGRDLTEWRAVAAG